MTMRPIVFHLLHKRFVERTSTVLLPVARGLRSRCAVLRLSIGLDARDQPRLLCAVRAFMFGRVLATFISRL